MVSDGCASFNAAGAQAAAHGAIIVGKRRSSELDACKSVNRFISNLKTTIIAPHHEVVTSSSTATAPALAEAQYHVNRRFDLASLVARLADNCGKPPHARSAGCGLPRSPQQLGDRANDRRPHTERRVAEVGLAVFRDEQLGR